jgi:signal peptidase II
VGSGENIVTRIHRLGLVIFVLFFCTGFDQITKDVAQERLAASAPISLLNDTIRIQYFENSGAALGLGSSLPSEVRLIFFVVFAGLILTVTLIYAVKAHDLSVAQLVSLSLVTSGGIGNLLDRLFNNGAAIDFMNIGIGSIRTGIFNFADVLIIAGASLFLLSSARGQLEATTN